MAITRFDQYESSGPRLNNFRLDYEKLAQPILARQQVYDDTQTGIDTYFDQVSNLPVHADDMGKLQSRINQTIQDEKELRASVNGDITDPLYQSQIRDRFRQEGNDNFYRKAIWNKTQLEARDEAYRAFKQANGYDPMEWQDSSAGFVNSFIDSETSGTFTFQGLTPRQEFTPGAMQYLQSGIVQAKLEQRGYEKIDNADGSFTYISHDGATLTAQDLKDILLENSEIMNSTSVDHMRNDYNEKVAKGMIDKSQYPDFDTYLDDTVNSIANNLAYEWNATDYVTTVQPYVAKEGGTGRGRAQAASSDQVVAELNQGSHITPKMAMNPIGFPTMTQGEKLYNALSNDIENLETTGVQDIKNVLGISGNAENPLQRGILRMVPNGNENGLGVPNLIYDFVDENGVERHLNLDGPEVMAYVNTYAGTDFGKKLAEAASLADKWVNQYSDHKGRMSMIQSLKDDAGNKIFPTYSKNTGEGTDVNTVSWEGPTGIKERGFYAAYLNDEQRDAVDTSPFMRSLNGALALKPDELRQSPDYARHLKNYKLYQQKLEELEVKKANGEISRVQGNALAQEYTAQMRGSEQYLNTNSPFAEATYSKEDIEALAKMFGISARSESIGTQRDADLRIKVLEAMTNASDEKMSQLRIEAREEAAKKYLRDDAYDGQGDPRFIEYEKVPEIVWEEGADRNLEDANPDIPGNKPGIRQVATTIYHFNADNSTEGERFKQASRQMIGAAIGAMLPGQGMDQRESASLIQVYRSNNNARISGEELKLLQGDWTLTGVAIAEEGLNIQIQSDFDPKTKYDPDNPVGEMLEIRNQDLVHTLLANAGFQHKNILAVTDQLTKQMQDTSGKYTDGRHVAGQGRGKMGETVTTMGETVIHSGGFKTPVFRSNRPMSWNGMELQEGEFAMYSLTDKRWIHTDNPIILATNIELDRMTQYELKKEHRLIGGTPFEGRADIKDEILSKGKDIINQPLYNKVSDMLNHPGMPRLTITSALRLKDDEETLRNPTSVHTIGDAIDFRIADPATGNLDAKTIESLIDYWTKNPQSDMMFQIEIPPSHAEYETYKTKYPKYVVGANVDAPHAHIQRQR